MHRLTLHLLTCRRPAPREYLITECAASLREHTGDSTHTFDTQQLLLQADAYAEAARIEAAYAAAQC